jgi:uncharacterized low-complexity protein
MNTKTSLKLALGTTIAAGIALGAAQALADNPFSAKTLDSGYMQLAENKAGGEMKCGAGMCGGNMKKGAAADGDTCPADTDKDGKVTKEEFLKHHEAMFDEADANKDGSLDADERKALHSKMAEGKCGGAKTDDAAKQETPAAAPAAPATEEKK